MRSYFCSSGFFASLRLKSSHLNLAFVSVKGVQSVVNEQGVLVVLPEEKRINSRTAFNRSQLSFAAELKCVRECLPRFGNHLEHYSHFRLEET